MEAYGGGADWMFILRQMNTQTKRVATHIKVD